MSDVLTREGYNVGSFAVDRHSTALAGEGGISEPQIIVGRKGVREAYLDETGSVVTKLHNNSYPESGVFAETWSSSFLKSIGTNSLLLTEMEGLTTSTEFPDTYLGDTFATISKLIATRDSRGSNVDMFYIERTGKVKSQKRSCLFKI